MAEDVFDNTMSPDPVDPGAVVDTGAPLDTGATPEGGATPQQPADVVVIDGKTFPLADVKKAVDGMENYEKLQGEYTRARQDLGKSTAAWEWVAKENPDIYQTLVQRLQGRGQVQPEARTNAFPAGPTEQQLASQSPELAELKRELNTLKEQSRLRQNVEEQKWVEDTWSGVFGQYDVPPEEKDHVRATYDEMIHNAPLIAEAAVHMYRARQGKNMGFDDAQKMMDKQRQTVRNMTTEGVGSAPGTRMGPDFDKMSAEELETHLERQIEAGRHSLS